MNLNSKSYIFILLIIFSNLVHSASISDGEILFKESCIQCHENSSEEMMIFSMNKLTNKIYGCVGQLDLPWNEQDVEDTAAYLDDKYFHFDFWKQN